MSAIPPLSLAEITARGIDPALKLLPEMMDSPAARIQLLTTGRQESRFLHRRQIILVADKQSGEMVPKPLGPAKSFWQAERGGGMVKGVRTHPATRDLARTLYAARKVRPNDTAIWNAIENDDVLAAGLARLLLWSDPHPMPAIGDWQDAWRLYLRTWRPGHPREETWHGFYQQSLEFVMGQEQ